MLQALKFLGIIFILSFEASCGIKHKNTPSVSLNFKLASIYSLDSNYYIDSIAFENNESEYPFYTLKWAAPLMLKTNQELNLRIRNDNYTAEGNFENMCNMKNVRILIFLKSKNLLEEYYLSAYYKCSSDSQIIIKAEGAI